MTLAPCLDCSFFACKAREEKSPESFQTVPFTKQLAKKKKNNTPQSDSLRAEFREFTDCFF